MKTLAFAFALLALSPVAGEAQVIRQNTGSVVSASSAAATYVNKAGDTMTGPLVCDIANGCYLRDSAGNAILELESASGSHFGYGTSSVTATSGVLQFIIGNAEIARYNATGLGIGTASPATKLHLSSGTLTVDGTGANIVARASNGTLTAESTSGAANGGTLDFKGTGASLASISFGQYLGVGLEFSFASSPKHYMDGTHFGINTANGSPATTLDVNGNAQFGSGATKSTFTATGFWEPYSRTKAQIDALVPTKVGQVIYASDTTLPGLCVSTGTAAAQWRKMESATLGCGTNN